VSLSDLSGATTEPTPAEVRVTCGYCSNQPAAYVLVMWWTAMKERTTEVVCEDCGESSIRDGGRLGIVHLYRVDFATPAREVHDVDA